MKSADTITYDDNGEVIPLSERFDDSKTDIRYSRDDSIIYPNMSENTREKILESSILRCVECDVDDASIDSITVESLIDLNHYT